MDEIGKYKYEEISNKVLRTDKKLLDDGSFEKSIDTNPHSLKGKVSAKDFGTNIKHSKVARDDEEKEQILKNMENSLKTTKTPKRVQQKRQHYKGSSALLDSTTIEPLNYVPTSESNVFTYNQIIEWCSQKLDNDLPEDVVASLADIIIELLKSDDSNSMSKKKLVEDALNQSIPDDDFLKLYNLINTITDYNSTTSAVNNNNNNNHNDDGLGIVMDSDYDDDDNTDHGDDGDNEDEDQDNQDELANLDELNQQQLINNEIDDPNYIVKLTSNKDNELEFLDYTTIDKYWLTKQLARYQPQLDSYRYSNIAKRIVSLLEQLMEGKVELRTFEHEIISIPDFQINELYYKLTKNYKKIYYAIKLANESDDDKKNEYISILQGIDNNSSKKRKVDSEQSEQFEQSKQSSKKLKIENSKITSNSTIQYPRNIDLNNLIFTQGSKLMTVSKFELPKGSFKRSRKSWEEIHIPAPEKAKLLPDEELVQISDLPEWVRSVFPSGEMTTLNRIQSKVFPTAFNDDSNILMCAPTGAGKTNVAMLTVLRTLSNFRNPNGKLQLQNFKIVYIAPLKALVQEQVREFDRRLSHLGIKVNELTGDSNLTKHQIESTQILVTTPEKWDVVTRKNNDISYINLVRLIIIDEIHLLHDERGPVLESIVARTMKIMEDNNDKKVRLVGLSATLPNYKDVAQFLRVKKNGLFYFDASYRPCPLAQQFVGITEKKSFKKYEAMNEVCYEKIIENITDGNQVIIFVHSRKETVKTAKWLANKLLEEEKLSNLMKFSSGIKEILRSESENVLNKGLKYVLPMGFGVHHAGLNRNDRQTSEDLFAEGHIKVLVSTATLAWGVNLPAHTVIIKGTSVYSPEKGTWVDLSPQDILQMLGRAGRPRYDTHGDGIIITSQDQIKYYLAVLNQQLPIESQMYSKLADSINAEIVAGTIRSLKDCISWMGYTYLYIRMLHSREIYFVGPQYENDPELIERRKDLSYSALLILAKNGLIKYNYLKDIIIPTDIGKIASYYYISYKNMKNFDAQLKPHLSEIELFRIFSSSEEFKFVPVRREERVELQKLIEKAPVPINEDVEDPLSKINVLLQAYISGLKLDGFALMADMIFISQSAGRLFRALYDLALRKGWSKLSKSLLNICKMVEKKLWLTNTPLRQYPNVPKDIINVAERSLTPWKYYLALNDPSMVIKSLKAEKYGNLVSELVSKFPQIDIEYSLHPVTPSLLQIDLDIKPHWKWDTSIHGFAESFTLLVEDCDGEKVLYNEKFIVYKDYVNQSQFLSLTVPLFEYEQPNYFVSLISDKWLFCDIKKPIMLTTLTVPKKFPAPTPVIESSLVPITELGIKEFASVFPFTHFNKFQSQAFDSVYKGDENILFGCSKGNGKTVIAILSILNYWRNGGGRAIYVAPNQNAIDLLLKSWKKKFSKLAGGKVVNKFSGDLNIDLQILPQSHLVLCTPEQFEAVSRRWQQRKSIQSIELIIADDCHTIGSGKQGTIYELVISRFRYIATNLEKNIRFVILSSSIASYKDFSDWIDVPKQNIFDFDPRERIYPLEVKFEYIDIFHNPSLLKCLIRPTYNAINDMNHKRGEETCNVFVQERRDVIDISKELVKMLRKDDVSWLRTDEASISTYLDKIEDITLKTVLKAGIGYLHDNMSSIDQKIVMSLYHAGVLKCIICTKEASHWCPSANLVIVLGTKEYDGRDHKYVDYSIDDILEMVGSSRISQDIVSRAMIFTNSSKLDYYKRFIALALPLESHINNFFHDALIGDIKLIKNRQYAVDWITYTLFYRRLQLNPSFYNLKDTSEDGLSEYLSDLVETTLNELEAANLVELNLDDGENEEEEEEENEEDKTEIIPLNNCMISNYYNISYSTMEILGTLDRKTRIKRILEIIGLSSEFDDLPVREYDKNILFKLYNSIPIKWSSEVDFESPALKVFILLQSYFSRIPLSTDHRSDLNMILPKSIQLLYACVDVLSSKGNLNAMLAMDICQMISQGMWSNENVLKQIPYFNDDIIKRCKEHGVGTVYDVMEVEDDVRDKIMEGLSETEISKVADFVNSYPNLEVSYHLEGDIIAGETQTINITINRDEEMEDPAMVSLMYPNKKFENWWIVLGNSSNNELYSIKKLAITKESQTIKMEFTIPEEGKHDINIWCICDSYLEADKQVEIKGLVVKSE